MISSQAPLAVKFQAWSQSARTWEAERPAAGERVERGRWKKTMVLFFNIFSILCNRFVWRNLGSWIIKVHELRFLPFFESRETWLENFRAASVKNFFRGFFPRRRKIHFWDFFVWSKVLSFVQKNEKFCLCQRSLTFWKGVKTFFSTKAEWDDVVDDNDDDNDANVGDGSAK